MMNAHEQKIADTLKALCDQYAKDSDRRIAAFKNAIANPLDPEANAEYKTALGGTKEFDSLMGELDALLHPAQ